MGGSGGQAAWKTAESVNLHQTHRSIRTAEMADGGWDPCECIFNHEMAMRRLLSLLRSSQSTCTDNECFTDGLPGPATATGGDGDPSGGFMMMAMAWMVMAMMMYFMRPNSLRGEPQGEPQGPPGGGNQDPRDPPAVS